MPSPNALAYLMLAVWPLICVLLWRRLDAAQALIWTILGGYLIMPPLTTMNLPVVPDLDKTTIPNLMALVGARFIRGDKIRFLPEGTMGRMLVVLYILSPVATVLSNGDPAIQPGLILPGIPAIDAVSQIFSQWVDVLPFVLARHYLGSKEGCQSILTTLILAGLVYSLPTMVEAVLSPQLNSWIYGFYQHDFSQTMRQGGFRPMVFLPHGLWLAFFMLMAMVSALVHATKARPDQRPKALAKFAYLAAMLLVCKSAGVLVYGLAASALILLTRARTQLLFAAMLGVLVMAYPVLRGAHLVPIEWIGDIAKGYSTDRAGSLQFRFDNEEILLAHAQERGLFGWGGYERNLLHASFNSQISTIADGGWIIVLGVFGWAGYIAKFGLMLLPLLVLARQALRARDRAVDGYVAGLALILALNMVDLLPNATFIPFTWLMVGALLGLSERSGQAQKATAQIQPTKASAAKKRTVI